MTLENLFIEQLMSNKQLLKRGRLIAWRQAEQRLPLGGRKFAGADKKSCGLSQKVERRFPRRAAAKGGGWRKQQEASGEHPSVWRGSGDSFNCLSRQTVKKDSC